MSYFSVSADIANPRLGHVWRDKKGDAFGTVRLGETDSQAALTFYSPADARAAAAACIATAEAMEALPPAEPENTDA